MDQANIIRCPQLTLVVEGPFVIEGVASTMTFLVAQAASRYSNCPSRCPGVFFSATTVLRTSPPTWHG
eukprot:4436939-Amphidinium_carterae.1